MAIIKTNNHPRAILGWHDLSKKEQKEFDWMDEETKDGAEFVRYKGWVYYINDFMRCWPDVEEMKGWDGYEADSYFSGVLIKFVDNYERVIMGRIYS